MIQHLHSFPFTFWSLSFNVQRCIPDKRQLRVQNVEQWQLNYGDCAFTYVHLHAFYTKCLLFIFCFEPNAQPHNYRGLNR